MRCPWKNSVNICPTIPASGRSLGIDCDLVRFILPLLFFFPSFNLEEGQDEHRLSGQPPLEADAWDVICRDKMDTDKCGLSSISGDPAKRAQPSGPSAFIILLLKARCLLRREGAGSRGFWEGDRGLCFRDRQNKHPGDCGCQNVERWGWGTMSSLATNGLWTYEFVK